MRDVSIRATYREKIAALAQLGTEVQALRSDEEIFQRVTAGLMALGLGVILVEPDGDGIRVRQAAASTPVEVDLAKAAGRPMSGLTGQWTPLTETAWKTGSAYADDAALDVAQFSQGARSGAMRRAVVTSGLLRGAATRIDVAGVPSCLLTVGGEWLSQEALAPFQLFGAQVSSALDASRVIADLKRRNAELAALNRLSSLAGTATDLSTLFKRGCDEIAAALSCLDVGVYFLEDSGLGLRLVHLHSEGEEAVHLLARISIDGPDSRMAKVVMRRQPQVWRRADHAPPFRAIIEKLGHETIASVPLVARSNVLGVMNVIYADVREVSPAELELLEAMGSHFAAAVEAHRLLEDLRGRVSDLGLLHEVGRSLVATLEPSQVLDLGVRNLARSIGVSEAFLLLSDAHEDRLVIRATSGEHSELLGHWLPLSPAASSVAAAAFHARAPITIEDADNDPRVDPGLRALTHGRAYLAMPLVVRDRAIGAVVLLDPLAPRNYTAAEVERASAIANQLAVAVENARLYDDLRASYAQLAKAQAQVVRQERLAALGELSAVVAHEVRNPLGVIFNSLGSLNRLLKPTGDAQMLLGIVGQEADRLNRIVGDLLDFARPSTPALRPEPLARVLDEAVEAAMDNSRPGVLLVRDIDPSLPRVPMDERLLRQAVLNIALNALQAMPNGGNLTVRAHTEKGAQGGVAVIELTDTGAGISSEARSHIFEPFFTTKATGTGLGLALVKRIVDDHRGEVRVTSAPGQGTTFTLRLPLEAPPA
jgi:signal transduction histidine kinase